MKQNLNSVVCAGCTCLCDDINVRLEGNQIVETKNACEIGKNWLQRTAVEPAFEIDGKQVDFDVAIDGAIQLLRQSRSPLICGLDGLSTQAQINAVEIAKSLHAVVDTTFTNGGRGSTLTMQSVGKVTATLGEVSSRADVVLFWYCDPVVTHPRLLERFFSSTEIVVIDETQTETAKLATQFTCLSRADVYAAISELRLAISNSGKQYLSEPAEAINSILQNATYAVSIYSSLDDHPSQYQNLKALYLLTQELNRRTRAVAIGLRNDANALSAENVLAWNSGFPFGVNFGLGVAEYNGLEFSTQSVLERGECDLVLACSTSSLAELSDAAFSQVQQLQSILIDDSKTNLEFQPAIKFNVGFEGGDWCRLDDVSLPVSLSIPSAGSNARTVLSEILQGLN